MRQHRKLEKPSKQKEARDSSADRTLKVIFFHIVFFFMYSNSKTSEPIQIMKILRSDVIAGNNLECMRSIQLGARLRDES